MPQYQPQPGDIAACYGRDLQSRFISLVTAWPLSPRGLRFGPSHVAIVAAKQPEGELHWYESTTMCGRPCLFHCREVNGMQVHQINDRIDDYLSRGGRVVIYRPTDRLLPVDQAELQSRLQDHLIDHTVYNMPAALFSAARLSRWLLNQMGVFRTDMMFCSHVISRVLKHIQFDLPGNPNYYTPGSMLRRLFRTGQYRRHLEIAEGWE